MNFNFIKIFFVAMVFFFSNYCSALVFDLNYQQQSFITPTLIEEKPLDFTLSSEKPEIRVDDVQRENSNYFLYNIGVDPDTDLPYNYTFVQPDGKLKIGFFNTPTDIGYYFAYLVGVAKGDIRNDILTQADALKRLKHALETLKAAPRRDGLLYWYDILSPKPEVAKFKFVSAIDNAFYAASLGLIVGAFIDDPSPEAQEVVKLAKELLEEQRQGWRNLYDPEKGLLRGGYFDQELLEKGEVNIFYSDRIYNEGRLATLMAIILGDVPRDAWDNLGEFYLDYTLSNGKKIKILAPWESAFQAWMPMVFIPEMEWSPKGFKLAHQKYLLVQKDFSQRESMPALYSESSDPFSKDKYNYLTGIAIPGASESWARGNSIRSDIGAVYAIGLAYIIDPNFALQRFNELVMRFPEVRTPLGWRDSVGRRGTEQVFWTVSNAYVGKDLFVLLSALNAKNNHRYFTRFLKEEGKLNYIKSLYQGKEFPLD